MKKTFLLFFLLPCWVVLLGQDHYRVLEIEYEYAPNNRQENLLENSVTIQEYEANVSLPLKRENGDAYILGFGYNDLKLYPIIGKTDPVPDTVMDHTHSFGRLRIQGGYSKKINEEVSIVGMGFFRVASDWVDVNAGHYLYGGLAMRIKKKSEKFTLKYGLYVNTEYYGWLVIPLVGVDWKVTDKFRIYGVLPRRLTMAWTLHNRYRVGFIWEAPNRTYRLSENSVSILSDGEALDTYVHNVKNIIYAFGEVYVTKRLVLRGRVGYSMYREIELYEYNKAKTFYTWGIEYGAKRTPISDVPAYLPLEDGLVLNASIEYRFSLE